MVMGNRQEAAAGSTATASRRVAAVLHQLLMRNE